MAWFLVVATKANFYWITSSLAKKITCLNQKVNNLIASTTGATGLAITAELDRNVYPKGLKIPDAELAKVNLKKASFHGEWNYTIAPSCAT